jgi:outer membrane protein assembly factor BamE (lipoprotein component of BamABCDE complex)
MRFAFLCTLSLALAGCSIVYRLPTRQGNVIEQKQLDQLKVGMTREQVKFLLGTPVASTTFRSDRWDYFGYYKSPHGKISSRNITLYFDGETLARMEGVQLAANDKALVTPDMETLSKEEKKDQNERSRADSERGKESGVSIPTTPTP